MSFQGSLKELHLPDVIQLVSVSGKSGSFVLQKEPEEGVIYLENGHIIHASMGDLSGEEAVYAMATWNEGTFRFVPGETSPQHSITKNNTNLLMEAARRMDEWRVLSKRIPSLEHVPRFQVPEGKQGQINLNTQEWLILSKIDGKTSIGEIAKSVNFSAFEVAKLLYGLITMGLIILEEPGTVVEDGGLTPQTFIPEEPPEMDGEVHEELRLLLRKLREEAQNAMGDVAWPVILRSYRKAKAELDDGKGTGAVQTMCQDILGHASKMEGPESQRLLAERFREVLASWNSSVS
jgi:predicted transcriptional regulator